MKPSLARLRLWMSLLACSLSLPASAQTPLLEIDHNSSAVFHVLSDGRVLLPLGAADGYVLTTDAAGYATWQAASSTGGLSMVSSDATLVGEGTVGSPLGVAVPLALSSAAPSGVMRGEHDNGHYGWFGSASVGAGGRHDNGNIGYLGHSEYGTWGKHHSGNEGALGGDIYGVWGQYGSGNFGLLGGDDFGVKGEHANGNYGWLGSSNYGIFGQNINGNFGILGSINYGVHGWNNSNNYGHLGSTNFGAYGEHNEGHWGSLGGSYYGAVGRNDNDNRGLLGHDSYGLWATGNPWAGFFEGDVFVNGALSKAGGAFKIDHPLDPGGKYLAHSFVESPDMMNVYNGNTTTDAEGFATVTLPDYFEALNRDFRYQLTVLGTFAQAIVAEKIQDNRFVIRTDGPGVEVSWQVTGIRRDPWAEANRIVVEAAKPAEERGYYLHPKLYGQPEERNVAWVRDPEGIRAMEEMPQRREDEQRRMEQAQQRRREEGRRP